MPDTECGFDQKHILLFTLDRAARMLLEGVGDLNERELREVEEPLSAPSHTTTGLSPSSPSRTERLSVGETTWTLLPHGRPLTAIDIPPS
jgi:hypothetical protein